ncbi:MAG: hypothetical protein M4579_006188 [Chaenotheca gracillima]|nr:MAG: hypothetical protein M4579_006188 [Chaenotheca gracillima]
MSAAVENVTASMAETTIADPAGAGASAEVTSTEPQATNAANNEAVLASAAEGRRLYIGNLAYATTDEELKEFFKGYLIESTSIPTNPRTNRPVGYAFVDLSTPTEAERAIAELSGKEILERKVSVQLARKPEPAGEKGDAASGGEGGSGGEGRRRGGARGRGRARARGGRAARGGRGLNGETDGPTNVPGQAASLTGTTSEGLAGAPGAEGTTTIDGKENKPRVPRERKQRGPPEDGVPSKTKVMVANLPYDLREDKLKELFASYEPASAKIALRPIPRFMVKKLQARNEPRKGRGFGFVTLASEEMQQKAVNEMNGKEIEGREIAVKVAIDSPGKEDEDEANAPAADAATDNIENGVTSEATATA